MSKQRPPFPLLTYRSKRPRRSGAFRFDIRAIFFFAVVIALIGSAGWLYLAQSSKVAGHAHRIRELQREKEQLHLETVVLRSYVAELGSLRRIMEYGQAIGYDLPEATDQDRRLMVELAMPAELQSTALEALEGATPSAEDSLWERLGRFADEMVQQFQRWLEATPSDH